MNILLYDIDGFCTEAIAERYALRLRHRIEELDSDGCLLSQPALRDEKERQQFSERMLSGGLRLDLVIARTDDNFCVVHYCSEPGALFTVAGDEEPETLLEDLIRIIDSHTGRLHAHEEVE